MSSSQQRVILSSVILVLFGAFIGFAFTQVMRSRFKETSQQVLTTPVAVPLRPQENVCQWPLKGWVSTPKDLMALLPNLFPAVQLHGRLLSTGVSADDYEVLHPCLNVDTDLIRSVSKPFTQFEPPNAHEQGQEEPVLLFRSYMCTECERFLFNFDNLDAASTEPEPTRILQVFVAGHEDWKSQFMDHSLKCALSQAASNQQRDWLVARISKLPRVGASQAEVDDEEFASYRKLLRDAFLAANMSQYADVCIPNQDAFEQGYESGREQALFPLQEFFAQSRHAYLFFDSAIYLADKDFVEELRILISEK